jgi:hypothetical protein
MIHLAPMPSTITFWCSANFYGAPLGMTVDGFESLSAGLAPGTVVSGSYATKDSAPLLFAGGFADRVTSKAAAGLDWSRFPPFALVDLDGAAGLSPADVAAAVALALPGVRVDLWTTHSHGGPKGTRMRALVALSRGPASPDDFRWVWAALNARAGLLGALAPDQVTHDATRGHAWPSAPIGTQPAYYRLPGLALDTARLIEFGQRLPLPRAQAAVVGVSQPTGVGLHALTRLDLLRYTKHAARTSKQTLPAAVNVCRGVAVAAEGARYVTMRSLIASLWHWVRREHGAWLDADSLWPLFEASCAVMAGTAVVPPDEAWLARLVNSYAPKGEARHQAATVHALMDLALPPV